VGFQLVPKSVTLNDLERRNGRMVVILRYSTEFGSFGAITSNSLKILSATKCSLKNLVISNMNMSIFLRANSLERGTPCRKQKELRDIWQRVTAMGCQLVLIKSHTRF